jgi:hypothetical protein
MMNPKTSIFLHVPDPDANKTCGMRISMSVMKIPVFCYLLATECFEIGRQAYVGQDYYHTIMWMQEAYEKILIERNETAPKTVVLDYLQFSLYKVSSSNCTVEYMSRSMTKPT